MTRTQVMLAAALLSCLSVDLAEAKARNVTSDRAERIQLADRLGMLTQRVAASTCALASGVAVEDSRLQLETAAHDFDMILAALTQGNGDLQIFGPETNQPILDDLAALQSTWDITRAALDAVLATPNDTAIAQSVDDLSASLSEKTHLLISDLVGIYADRNVGTNSDAMAIEIAGQQRKLTQQMAKSACEIWTGDHAETASQDLSDTISLFETSLHALRHGIPEAGLDAAPTQEIAQELDRLIAGWGNVRVDLERLVIGDELSSADREALVGELNAEALALGRILRLYARYTKRHHSG